MDVLTDILIISLFILTPIAIYVFMTQNREMPFDVDKVVEALKEEENSPNL